MCLFLHTSMHRNIPEKACHNKGRPSTIMKKHVMTKEDHQIYWRKRKTYHNKGWPLNNIFKLHLCSQTYDFFGVGGEGGVNKFCYLFILCFPYGKFTATAALPCLLLTVLGLVRVPQNWARAVFPSGAMGSFSRHVPVVHGALICHLLQSTRHWIHHPDTERGGGYAVTGFEPTLIRSSIKCFNHW